MKSTTKAVEILKKNRKCINRIAYVLEAHAGTVERWILENINDGRLTTETAIKIIMEETGLKKNEILTTK